jgi:hypothetical protein
MNNKNRVNKIKKLLGLLEDDEARDDETHYYRVADAICDLRHYCDNHAIDFEQEIYMANVFYKDETEEGAI